MPKTYGSHVKIIFFKCFLPLLILIHYIKNSVLIKFNTIKVLITSLSVFLDFLQIAFKVFKSWSHHCKIYYLMSFTDSYLVIFSYI